MVDRAAATAAARQADPVEVRRAEPARAGKVVAPRVPSAVRRSVEARRVTVVLEGRGQVGSGRVVQSRRVRVEAWLVRVQQVRVAAARAWLVRARVAWVVRVSVVRVMPVWMVLALA